MSGTAIPILSINNDAITLNPHAINSVLDKVGERPFVIISINGKFRKGKSLMLNFFLQFLQSQNRQRVPVPSNWFQPQSVGRAFNWRGGAEAETNGINIWSEPFFVNVNGQETAILLMDTQGSFDMETSLQHNTVIFALSALLSSVMIMNVETSISEDMLQFFQFFTGFAQIAVNDESVPEQA
jgi:atlastin